MTSISRCALFLAAFCLPWAPRQTGAQSPRADTLGVMVTQVATPAAFLPPSVALAVMADTPVVQRPKAIEYSDAYYTRLTIHRYGSYVMIPLFIAEYSLGQNLMNDASPSSWMKPTHSLVAGGIGVVFGVNTITGAWNLWDSRADPNGRTRRIVHTVLMLVADAGFAATGATAPEHDDFFFNSNDYLNRRRLHRDLAIGSIALSTVSGAMMWFWK